MNNPSPFIESVRQALTASDSLASLRELANRQLAKGVTRETLTAWFEQARDQFPEHEDRLLEILDLVVGWCSPHQALEAAEAVKGPGPEFPVLNSTRPIDLGK